MNTGFAQDLENTQWIKVRALTPVHVGTDQAKTWLKDIDFDYERGKIYPVDKERFLHSLSNDEIQELCLYPDSRKLAEKRKNYRLEQGYDFPRECVDQRFRSVNPQIRDGFGRPYLPGSSLKGAMRAILHAAKKPVRKDERSFVDRDLLGKISDSPLRFMRVSDGYLSKTEVFPTKILSLRKNDNDWTAGWKHDRNGSVRNLQPAAFMTAYEAFPAGAEGVFRLSLLPELMNWLKNVRHEKIVGLSEIGSIAALFKCVNANMRQRIQAELNYISRVAGALSESDALIEPWQRLLNHLPDAQENGSRCILRLGRNVGAHSTTGNWEFGDEYYKATERELNRDSGSKKARKTRKFALRFRDEDWQFQPFGFVELSLIEGQEAARKLHEEHLVVPEKSAFAQASTSIIQVEELPVEPPQLLEPEAFKGKLKVGTLLDAVALQNEGNDVVVELHIEGGNQTVKFRYPSGLEPGSVHRVSVVKVKDGKVEQIAYKSRKK